MLLRGNGERATARLPRHAIIAVGMVVRHEPLVAPEPMHPLPGKSRRHRGLGKHVHTGASASIRPSSRSRTASRSPSARSHEPFGRYPRQRLARPRTCAFSAGAGPDHRSLRMGTVARGSRMNLHRLGEAFVARWSPVTRSACACTSGLALPIAMLRPLLRNISTSLGMSPIVAISRREPTAASTASVTTSPLLASGWVTSR